jgi:hypothetical protein
LRGIVLNYTIGFLIDIINLVFVFTFIVGIFMASFITIFLTIKLRKIKLTLINNIGNSAPEKFKERSFLFMTTLMPSWILGSMVGYIWLVRPVLHSRHWGVKKNEIHEWKASIKKSLGSTYPLYLLCSTSWNLGITSMIYTIIRVCWSSV